MKGEVILLMVRNGYKVEADNERGGNDKYWW